MIWIGGLILVIIGVIFFVAYLDTLFKPKDMAKDKKPKPPVTNADDTGGVQYDENGNPIPPTTPPKPPGNQNG